MDHVNNAVYLDWLEDAVLAAAAADGGRARSTRCRDATGSSTRRRPTPAWPLTDAVWREAAGPGATGSPRPAARSCSGPRSNRSEAPHEPNRRPRWPCLRRHRRRAGRAATSRSRTAGSSTSGPGSTATRRSTSPAGRSCRGSSTATSTSCSIGVDPLAASPSAVLVPVLRGGAGTWPRRSRIGDHHRSATPAAPTSGSSRRVEDGLIPGPRMQISISCSARPAATATTGTRRGADDPVLHAPHPGRPCGHRRRPRRGPAQGPRARPERRRRHQDRGRAAACCRRATNPRHAHFRPEPSSP